MGSWLVVLVLCAPLALVGVYGFAAWCPGSRPRALLAGSGVAAWLGVVVSALAATAVVRWGTLASPLLGFHQLGLSIRLDALSVTMLVMVSLLGVVIVRYSQTYLDGDPRQGVFMGRLALTIAAVQVLVLAGHLALLWMAWVATSLCLHQLLLFYPERPRAVIAARKKFLAARLGDLAMAVAFYLITIQFNTGELGEIFDQALVCTPTAATEAATLLIALAALLKSAQFPTHGWLVEVMETPTPVSALLHAGILNAGPFLVIRFAAFMELGNTSAMLLVLCGGFTALFASVALLTQPTVKTALGYSSVAHMGFMLLVGGLGVYAAAVLHLVAHSFYKAHAFLSAGSTVEVVRSRRVRLPARLGSPARIGAALLAALGIYFAIAMVLGFAPWEHPALLAVGAILVMGLTQLLVAGIDSRIRPRATLVVIGLAAMVTLAFFGLEHAAHVLLIDVLPEAKRPDVPTIVLAALVLVSFAMASLVQATGLGAGSKAAQSLYVHLKNGFYANAMLDRLVGALKQ